MRRPLSAEDQAAIARLRQLEADKPPGWWEEGVAILRAGAARREVSRSQ